LYSIKSMRQCPTWEVNNHPDIQNVPRHHGTLKFTMLEPDNENLWRFGSSSLSNCTSDTGTNISSCPAPEAILKWGRKKG
jgi:hypothetical protein